MVLESDPGHLSAEDFELLYENGGDVERILDECGSISYNYLRSVLNNQVCERVIHFDPEEVRDGRLASFNPLRDKEIVVGLPPSDRTSILDNSLSANIVHEHYHANQFYSKNIPPGICDHVKEAHAYAATLHYSGLIDDIEKRKIFLESLNNHSQIDERTYREVKDIFGVFDRSEDKEQAIIDILNDREQKRIEEESEDWMDLSLSYS